MEDILFEILALENVLIVKLQAVRTANNDNFFLVGEITKSPGVGKCVEYFSGNCQNVFSGAIDLAGDVKLFAAYGLQTDADVRAVDEILQALF